MFSGANNCYYVSFSQVPDFRKQDPPRDLKLVCFCPPSMVMAAAAFCLGKSTNSIHALQLLSPLYFGFCMKQQKLAFWFTCKAQGWGEMGYRLAPPSEDMCGLSPYHGALVISMPHLPWYA